MNVAGRRQWIAALGMMVLAAGWAQAQVWQPGRGLQQVPIWPGAAPDARANVGPERLETASGNDMVAGRPWLSIDRVSRPTMTVYPPKGRNTGAAVVVFPGGGYQVLAIDLEGSEICDWLTAKGVTCVLLKYRVAGDNVRPHSGPYPQSREALEDAQRTIRLVRSGAARLHVDPHKIGVIGFSAGGHLVVATSVYSGERIYPRVDAVDDVSCRPDFAMAIYPGHLNLQAAEWDADAAGAKPEKLPVSPGGVDGIRDKRLALNPAIHVTKDVPPTFLLQNEDDRVDSMYDAVAYMIALERAGVPAELHVYAHGGHAFGLRRTKLAATAWPDLAETWMRGLGVLPPS